MKNLKVFPVVTSLLVSILILMSEMLVYEKQMTLRQWLVGGILAMLSGLLVWTILQRRQSQQEAREEQSRRLGEDRMRLAIEASDGCYFEYTTDYKSGYADPRWMQITGYTAQDLSPGTGLVDRCLEKIHPDERKKIAVLYQDFLLGKSPFFQFECRFQHKLGSWRWIRGMSRAVARTPLGMASEVVGILFDITHDKEMEESLLVIQAGLQAAANAIIITDVNGTIVWVNDAFTQLTGFSAEEAIGQNPRLLKSGKLNPEFYQNMRDTIAAGNVWRGEVINKRKDGTLYDEEMTITPVRGREGAIDYYIAIKQDISERKVRDIELHKAKEAAEAANKAKSDFLANMSHEIRTPMNGILGMTGLMLRTNMTDEQREYLRTIKQSGEALMVVIDELLDFSKIEAGQMKLESIEFDPYECLTDTLRAIAVRAHEKKLELLVNIDKKVPHGVLGDPIRLRQILLNLVGNAIKFTERGQIQVSARLESQSKERISLEVKVQDTGIGIAKTKQIEIFRPFAQADATMSRKYGGTGLGLAITSRLVKMMGGRIWLDSEPGRGSTFYFLVNFKLSAKASSESSVVTGTAADVAGLGVLVVDDNESNLAILRDMLRGWNMTPTTVSSGKEAIQTILKSREQNHPFALILFDAQMPEMDGFELGRYLRDKLKVKCPRIIMLSSLDRTADTARCQELGINHILMKPVSQSDLWDVVVRAINQQTSSESPTASTSSSSGWLPVISQSQFQILLVEDNEVNQKLATLLLREMGHMVHAVPNGAEAVKAVEEGHYDLVLMDIQMPVMDGFEATRIIRQMETRTTRHLPIIAMTAHAIQGDRERCLAAGMDGYIAKPVRPRILASTLNTVMENCANTKLSGAGTSSEISLGEPVPALPEEADLNEAELHERFGGSRNRVGKFAKHFFELTPGMLADIRKAIELKDAKQLRFAAHKFKGSVSVFTSGPTFHLAQELEHQGETGNLAGSAVKLDNLENAVVRLQNSLAPYMTNAATEVNRQ